MGKVRMADIAAKVGVSTVTVHNALSGNKGVSDEMREKIQKVADELGYHQMTAAAKRERNKGGLRNIGVIISEKYLAAYTTFYWKMYQELALVATDKNCMAAVEILKQVWRRILPSEIQEEHTVDALIVMGEISREYIHFMKKYTDVPVIFLDFYDKELAKDAVIADNFYGMYLMTGYLFEQGFTKMAYVGSIHVTSSIMDRYCGFYKAQLEHGQVLPEEWLIEDRDEKGVSINIKLPEHMPEAFVCNCDLTAGNLIVELEKQGYRVPEDISVVGFDNYLYPGFPDKKITSYEVNTQVMVKVALEKALKQIKNPASGRGLSVVSGKIVEKESVRKKI